MIALGLDMGKGALCCNGIWMYFEKRYSPILFVFLNCIFRDLASFRLLAFLVDSLRISMRMNYEFKMTKSFKIILV